MDLGDSTSVDARAIVTSAAVTLALVWLMNFFVVLPALNPAFTELLPYPLTFASKLLFAIAMAGMLQYA